MRGAGRWRRTASPSPQPSHCQQGRGTPPLLRLRSRLTLPQGEAGGGHSLDPDAIEHIARTLLRRYGVVFWKLLEREAPWLPSWRELLRVYHRLEARGEIRGGRFVEGLVGEQFALPEAIAPLRAMRQRADDGELVCLSGCDPLNLVGTVLVGDKVPALAGSRVLYRDGMAIAALVGGKVVPLIELSEADAQRGETGAAASSALAAGRGDGGALDGLPADPAAVSAGLRHRLSDCGRIGGVWGAGIGLLLGVLAMILLVRAMRGRR